MSCSEAEGEKTKYTAKASLEEHKDQKQMRKTSYDFLEGFDVQESFLSTCFTSRIFVITVKMPSKRWR